MFNHPPRSLQEALQLAFLKPLAARGPLAASSTGLVTVAATASSMKAPAVRQGNDHPRSRGDEQHPDSR